MGRRKMDPVAGDEAPELSVEDFSAVVDEGVEGTGGEPRANGKCGGDEREPGQSLVAGGDYFFRTHNQRAKAIRPNAAAQVASSAPPPE